MRVDQVVATVAVLSMTGARRSCKTRGMGAGFIDAALSAVTRAKFPPLQSKTSHDHVMSVVQRQIQNREREKENVEVEYEEK